MNDCEKNSPELTAEATKRLLREVFEDEPAEDEDEWEPRTITEKVSYAEHCATGSLDHLGWAIQRLSRLHRLLVVAKDDLPKIIAYNEAKVALERLLHVKADIDDAISMMEQIMDETRQEAPTCDT